jgi:hypothetical protein
MNKMKEDAQAVIEGSGNTFHSKVVGEFQKQGWSVLISPYYNDNVTDKPREIDLVAEKAIPVYGPFRRHLPDIDLRLFVECKYVPQPTVFWFHDKDAKSARDLVLRTTPMKDNNINTDKHHYLCSSPQVAKLFATRNSGPESDPIYKALNQSLNGMVSLRHTESIILDEERGFREKGRTLTYPVILCNSFDQFYKVTIGSEEPPSPITGGFQMEVNYAYVDSSQRHQQEYFLIDIVDFKGIEDYFKTLKDDVDAMMVFL